MAKPDTILAWYRRLITKRFDGLRFRSYPARPRISREVTDLILQMEKRIPAGVMIASLEHWLIGHVVSDQTVGNILRRYGVAPAPKRSQGTTWRDFIAAHMAVLAGIDFFTVEVLTWHGLATYYVLFFIHLGSRRVTIGGIIKHPTEEWILQIGRNATDANAGRLKQCRYVLHDRDSKFTASFRETLQSAGAKPLRLPPQSPNLNAFAERWVRSVKDECLRELILFGEGSLKRALTEFTEHYHSERPHQAKGNVLLFPTRDQPLVDGPVPCNARLGGLLRYYSRTA